MGSRWAAKRDSADGSRTDGVSCQVVPAVLEKLMHDRDPVEAGRVTQAMFKMLKLDIAKTTPVR